MRTNAPEDNHVDEGVPMLLGSFVDVGPVAMSSKSSCSSVSRDEENELATREGTWTFLNVTPRDRCARCRAVICCCCLVIACVSCISYHVIMCIASAYVFVLCIRAFFPLSVLQSGASFSSGGHFYLSFMCGD